MCKCQNCQNEDKLRNMNNSSTVDDGERSRKLDRELNDFLNRNRCTKSNPLTQ